MAEKKRKVLTVDTGKEPAKVKFVVKPGQKFGLARLGAGEEVELTVAEAIPFSDKIEPADRGTVLPGDATADELADSEYKAVRLPTATTDRQDMTPQQRASTSQVDTEAGKSKSPPAAEPRAEPARKSKSEEK